MYVYLPVKRKKLSYNDSYMYICIYMYIYTMCLRYTLPREANMYLHVYIYEYYAARRIFCVRAIEITCNYG